MKRLWVSGLLVLLTFLGLASAQKYGAYLGYSGAGYTFKTTVGGVDISFPVDVGSFNLGGFYALSENWRLGGDLRFGSVSSGTAHDNVMGLSLHGDYIIGRMAISEDKPGFEFYYGAAGELALYFGKDDTTNTSYTVSELNLNALAGVVYPLEGEMGVFGELLLGPSFGGLSAGDTSLTAFSLFTYSIRIGVSFY